MRMVCYNILNGGADRCSLLAGVIRGQRPDIVGLVEADDPDVVRVLARGLEMGFVHAKGMGDAVALMSRWPIQESINHGVLRRGLSKSCVEATVIGPGGREWVIGLLHLHPRATEADERAREQELAVVLDAFARHRQRGNPHLLAGDFNANSPVQEIDITRCKPKTRLEWERNGNRIPRRVVQTILDAGYLDGMAVCDPVAASNRGTFTTEFPGQRVDYIFTFGVERAQLRSGWIEAGSDASKASDHFPIGLEISE